MGEGRIEIGKHNLIKAGEFIQLLTDNGSHSANSDNHCIRHSDHRPLEGGSSFREATLSFRATLRKRTSLALDGLCGRAWKKAP
jgi:hypothetical protein